MLPPLVIILAIADDVHIVQHFNHELRATGSKEHAFKSSVQHLFVPLLGASGTTALGLLSLATSDVVAVRSFGIGAAVGVMVDFVMSLVLVPTLLMLLKPETGVAPQERYLLGPMQRVARFSIRNARPVAIVTVAGRWRWRRPACSGCASTPTTSTSSPTIIRCTSRRRSSTRSCRASTASTSCSRASPTR